MGKSRDLISNLVTTQEVFKTLHLVQQASRFNTHIYLKTKQTKKLLLMDFHQLS